jgi:type IV secretory pathway component VirB8
VNDFVHHTTALHPDARREQYREVRSFRTLRERMQRNFSRTGYVLAGTFAVIAIGEIARGLLYPMTVHDIIYVEHDRTTGWVGRAVGVHDAPATFGDKEARAAISEYVWARERYVPQIQQQAEKRVQAMSSLPVWLDYTAAIHERSSPKQRLGASGGHVDVFGLSFGAPLVSADGITITYTVRYSRREVKAAESSDAAVLTCNTRISFQWHPEQIQDEAAAQLNPTGFEALDYQRPDCS